MTSTSDSRSFSTCVASWVSRLVAFATFFAASYAGAATTFGPEQVITTAANGAQTVFSIDIDGDGDNDAVSAALLGNEIAWYENVNGDGSVWTKRVIASLSSGRAASAGDIDGDGDIDVVSAAGDNIRWHENDGADPPNWTTRNIAGGIFSSGGIWVGDINGDGALDVASTSNNLNQVAWHQNSGDGTSWTTRVVTTNMPSTQTVVGADVDGDGDTDLVAAADGGQPGKVAWFENVGGLGTSWTERQVSSFFGTFQPGLISVDAVDIDGDNDIDVLASGYLPSIAPSPGRIWLWRNTAGDGSSWSTTTIAFAPGDAVYGADLDGDGDQDVVKTSRFNNDVVWYENTAGTGLSWAATTISGSADGGRDVFASDVDGDGDLDILAASNDDDKVAWYENAPAAPAGADVAISKSATPGTVAPGGSITFDLTATNNGPDAATGVTVNDTLPAGTVFVSASAGCSESGGVVTCNVGDLAAAGSTPLSITVTAPASEGELTNTATISANEDDPESANNTSSATVNVVIQVFSVTASVSGGNGSVDCDPSSVSAGGSSTCTAVPDSGFRVSAWTGACASAGTSESCALNNIQSDQSSTVSFETIPVVTYSVTATVSGGNGSVSCSPTSVAAGGSSTCTAVPDSGFRVSAWTGACASAGNSTSCTLDNIQSDQSSTVTFEAAPSPDGAKPIPTLSAWGLVILGLIMAGVVAFRRQLSL